MPPLFPATSLRQGRQDGALLLPPCLRNWDWCLWSAVCSAMLASCIRAWATEISVPLFSCLHAVHNSYFSACQYMHTHCCVSSKLLSRPVCWHLVSVYKFIYAWTMKQGQPRVWHTYGIRYGGIYGHDVVSATALATSAVCRCCTRQRTMSFMRLDEG